MKTDAQFIGKDGSCGLKRGQIYRIEIVENPQDRYRFRVWVNGRGIPYDTMNGIRKNWEIIRD